MMITKLSRRLHAADPACAGNAAHSVTFAGAAG